MYKGHRALTKKVPLDDGTDMCVWERLRQNRAFGRYVEAVHDIGEEVFDEIQIGGEDAPVPDPLSRSTVKSLMNFLINVIPKPSVGEQAVR